LDQIESVIFMVHYRNAVISSPSCFTGIRVIILSSSKEDIK
jgi:hypothetical protein